jgi:hypothetical protein
VGDFKAVAVAGDSQTASGSQSTVYCPQSTVHNDRRWG